MAVISFLDIDSNFLIYFIFLNSFSVQLIRDCKSFVVKSTPIRSDSDSNSGIVIVTIRNFPFSRSLIETAAVAKNLNDFL